MLRVIAPRHAMLVRFSSRWRAHSDPLERFGKHNNDVDREDNVVTRDDGGGGDNDTRARERMKLLNCEVYQSSSRDQFSFFITSHVLILDKNEQSRERLLFWETKR